MTQQSRPVGVIGTGLMGTACAKRLLGAGFDVLGHDTDAGKLGPLEALGGRAARSTAEIARSCDKVVLAVFDTDQVEGAIEGPDGLLAGRPVGRPPLIAVCVSTCDPDRVAALAARESAAYSQVMDVKGGKMVKGDFAPHGFITQSLKDFSLMAGQAQRTGQRLPLAETHAGLMQGCVAAGEGELDNSVVIQEIRRRWTKA